MNTGLRHQNLLNIEQRIEMFFTYSIQGFQLEKDCIKFIVKTLPTLSFNG